MSLIDTRDTTSSSVPSALSSPLRLPAHAELFAPSGLHQLFERVDLASDKPLERSWLYVPATVLQQLFSQESNPESPSSSIRVGRPVEADEQQLVPLIHDAGVAGLLALPAGSSSELNQDQLADCGRLLVSRYRNHEVVESDVAVEFAQELFQRDDGAEQFLKRLLSLVVGYWPRSSAGIYVESQGIYQLRLVVGDVMRCHELPSHLSQDTTFKFLEALCQRENLIPADTLQNSPTFLNMAPDFFFVHQGLKSERTNQLLVIAGPGEVPPQGIRKIRLVSRLLSHLRESQFVTSHELIDLYARVGARGLGGVSLDAETKDLYGVVARQVNASRMTITRFGTAGGQATSWIASGYPTSQVRTQDETNLRLPDKARECLLKGEQYHISDISMGELPESQAKQLYMENVQSEIFVPVKCHKRVAGLLLVGSPVTGDYLTRFSTFFDSIASYAGTLMTLESLSDQRMVPGSESAPIDSSTSRLTTVRKLIDGFLHGLSSRVSVVIGQAELLNASIDDPRPGMRNEFSGLEKITVAGNELASQIGSLRTIVDLLESNQESSLDGAQFLRDLPELFEGFARKMKDTRNVETPINFTASVRQPYRLRMSDAIDVLVPFLIGIMEQAICSGTLSVQGSIKGTVPVISFQFRKNLLGYTTIESLITRLFPNAERVSGGKTEDMYRFDDRTLACRVINDESYHITLTCGAAMSAESLPPMNLSNRNI